MILMSTDSHPAAMALNAIRENSIRLPPIDTAADEQIGKAGKREQNKMQIKRTSGADRRGLRSQIRRGEINDMLA